MQHKSDPTNTGSTHPPVTNLKDKMQHKSDPTNTVWLVGHYVPISLGQKLYSQTREPEAGKKPRGEKKQKKRERKLGLGRGRSEEFCEQVLAAEQNELGWG